MNEEGWVNINQGKNIFYYYLAIHYLALTFFF